MLTPKELGAFIREQRLEKGWTQKQLAEQLTVTDKAVSRWERGLGFPDIQFLEPLARTLDVSMQELLSGKKTAQATPVAIPPQNSIQKIIDEFSEARDLFQKKVRKRKRIVCSLLAAALIFFIFCFVPVPQRVSHTLSGEARLQDGSTVEATVQINGWVWHHFFEGTPWEHNFTFHQRYFRGDICFALPTIEESLTVWHFTGKGTATGSDRPGHLLLWPSDPFRENAFYQLSGIAFPDDTYDLRISTDYTMLVLGESTSLDVQIVASEDPYTDYQKLYEQFSGQYR